MASSVLGKRLREETTQSAGNASIVIHSSFFNFLLTRGNQRRLQSICASRDGHEAQLSTMRTRIPSSQGASAMPHMTSRSWKWMSLRTRSKHPADHPNMHRCPPSTPRLGDVFLYLLRRSTHISELQKIFPVSTSRAEQRADVNPRQRKTRSQRRLRHHRLLDIEMHSPRKSRSHLDIV